MQQRQPGWLGFAVRHGLFSFGPILFMLSLLIDEAFGTRSFGSNLYARAVMALAVGFCWGVAMGRILPRAGSRSS